MAVQVCFLLLLLVGCAHSAVPHALPEERWMGQQFSEPLPLLQDAYQQESNNSQGNDLSAASVEAMGLEECKEEVRARGYESVSPDCKEKLKRTKEICRLDSQKVGNISSELCAEIEVGPVLGDYGMGSHQCGSSGLASSTPPYFKSQNFFPGQTNMDALEVLTLPIGQGDCTVIYCPGGTHAVLFDCGSTGGRDHRFSPKIVALFFRNVKRITIIISHGDQDHYNYLPYVFSDPLLREKITKVYLGGPKDDYINLRCPIKKFLDDLKPMVESLEVKAENSPKYIDMCGNPAVHFNIIAAGLGTQKNEKSVVMKLCVDSCESSLLFAGDMEGESAEQLTLFDKTRHLLKSTHYKVAHHGATNKTDKNNEITIPCNSMNWLKAISPIEAHFSHSYSGSFAHPHCDTVDRLKGVGSIGRTNGAGHVFSCLIAKKEEKPGEDYYCDRLFSTSPAAGGMCVIKLTFLLRPPATIQRPPKRGREPDSAWQQATTTIVCDYAQNWDIRETEIPIDEKEED